MCTRSPRRAAARSVVNGRRVEDRGHPRALRVSPAALAMMNLKLNPANLQYGPDRFQAMDAQGIDIEALSINPFWYKADRDAAEKLIKLQNEKLAELVGQHPDRFVAFTTVAMQHPDLRRGQQLEYGIKKLGLRGMSVSAGVEAWSSPIPSSIRSGAQCEDSGCLVFMHPGGTPGARQAARRQRRTRSTPSANPLETTIALSHL